MPWYEVLGFVLWCALVAYLTLTPSAGWRGGMWSSCLFCGKLGGADLVRNVLMFMPAGVFFLRRGFTPTVTIGIGLLLSSGIEFAQWFLPGRHASPVDVLTNGLGAGLGGLLYLALLVEFERRERLAIVAAAIFPLLVVSATGWLHHPTATDGTYYAQWVPKRSYYAPWDGVLLDARIDGVQTPIGQLENSDALRAALLRGAPVTLQLRRGTPTNSLVAVYVVMDDSRREILMIGVSGADLVVRHRLRSTTFRFDLPDQRFRNFLELAPPDGIVELRMTRDREGRTCVATARRSECAVLPSLGAVWRVVLWKGELAAPLRRLLDGAALALLLLPASIIAGLRCNTRSLAAFVTLAAVFVALGREVGLSWPGIAELVAAVGSLALGRWLTHGLRGGTRR